MLKSQPSFTDFSPCFIKDCIGIVPFHKSEWRTGEDKSIVNFTYLLKTLASLSHIVCKIIVYSDQDISFVCSLFKNVYFKKITVPQETESGKLVFPIGKYAIMEKDWSNYKFVFFTESDQLIYSNKIILPEDNQYISPHRLEQIFRNHNRRKNKQKVYFDRKNYILYNEFPCENEYYSNFFYRAKSFRASYGAAWIARSNFLEIIDFSKYKNRALHAPCLALFEKGVALKTINKFDFFVDHLSGFDNSLSQGGFSIKNFPSKW